MSTDYEDREREFLTYLKADTGRDLAGWMSAINEAKLAHRNEIIDWLRQQGFIFAWASWMERIHHNGGRPIYLDEAPASLAAPTRSASGSRPSASAPPPPVTATPGATVSGSRTDALTRKDSAVLPPAAPPPAPQPSAARARPVLVYSAPPPEEPSQPVAPAPPAPQPASPPAASPSRPEPQQMPAPALTQTQAPVQAPVQASVQASVLSPEVSALIAKAKAYTPLAGFILRSIAEALPGTALQVSGSYVACNRPGTFAILVPGPKDIKLGLALASAPFGREIIAARFPNLSPAPPKSVTYMAVLTDARQVDAGLLDLLRSADAAANG